MDSAEAAALCAVHHIARARLLVDALAESKRITQHKELETTLRVITAELSHASAALGRPAPKQRRLTEAGAELMRMLEAP
jgi:hypothetical protein